jgi:hypothetical protein
MAAIAFASRPEADEYAEHYSYYISLVKGSDALASLKSQLTHTLGLLRSISPEKALHRYEPGKWSIKEVAGHIIDTERVFTYRALRFARGDQTPLSGFDQDTWIPFMGADARSWDSLIEEYEAVRRSTIALFANLEPAAWTRRGTAWDRPFSVRAMAYIAAGHELNHTQIIGERYLK